MTNHTRFIWLLAVVTTCATLALAQDASTTPQRIFSHSAKIETSYDQVKEITTVGLCPTQVYGEARFNAFTYSGRTLRAQPQRVLFSLISTSQDWKYMIGSPS